MFSQTVHQPSEQARSPHDNVAYLSRDSTNIYHYSLINLSFSWHISLIWRLSDSSALHSATLLLHSPFL